MKCIRKFYRLIIVWLMIHFPKWIKFETYIAVRCRSKDYVCCDGQLYMACLWANWMRIRTRSGDMYLVMSISARLTAPRLVITWMTSREVSGTLQAVTEASGTITATAPLARPLPQRKQSRTAWDIMNRWQTVWQGSI